MSKESPEKFTTLNERIFQKRWESKHQHNPNEMGTKPATAEEILHITKRQAIHSAGIYDGSPIHGMSSDRLKDYIYNKTLPNLEKALKCQVEIEELQASRSIE